MKRLEVCETLIFASLKLQFRYKEKAGCSWSEWAFWGTGLFLDMNGEFVPIAAAKTKTFLVDFTHNG